APANTQHLALYLPRWQTIGKLSIYVDRRLLYHSATGPAWNGFNHPMRLSLQAAGEEAPRELLIRIDFQRSAGLALSPLWLGEESALETPFQGAGSPADPGVVVYLAQCQRPRLAGHYHLLLLFSPAPAALPAAGVHIIG